MNKVRRIIRNVNFVNVRGDTSEEIWPLRGFFAPVSGGFPA